MYVIYADNAILHHPRLFRDGRAVASPTLTEEVNKQGSLTFSVAPSNPLYDAISERITSVKVTDDAAHEWRGRVLYTEDNIQGLRSVYCEGELAYLNDSIQRPFVYGGTVSALFSQAIAAHNEQVDSTRQFTVGQVTVTSFDSNNNDHIFRSSDKAMTTWEFLKQKLFGSSLGGYIRTRKVGSTVYIDYLAAFSHTNTQKIEFGENLLEFKRLITSEDVITCLIPYGSRLNTEYTEEEPDPADSPNNIQRWGGNRLTIKAVNGGNDYVQNPAAVAIWGKIWGSKIWDDVKYAQNLLLKAQDYISLDAQISSKITVDVGAIDKSIFDLSAESIEVGDTVQLESKPHNISVSLICSKKVTPLVNLGDAKIVLGVPDETLTGEREENDN